MPDLAERMCMASVESHIALPCVPGSVPDYPVRDFGRGQIIAEQDRNS